MKTTTISLILLIIGLASSYTEAQEIEIGNNYFFKGTLSHELSSSKMKANTSDAVKAAVHISENARIKISDVDEDRIYFTYLNYSDSSPNYKIYNCEDGNEDPLTFSMDKDDFEKHTDPLYDYF